MERKGREVKLARFIHIADVHLGAKFSFLDPDRQEIRRSDLENAFIRSVDFALDPDNRIDGFWIAGDLFDMINPPEKLVNLVRNQFSRLVKADKDVVLVPGTHDPSIYPESVYRKYDFPGVEILNNPVIGEPLHKKYGDQDFYFYGFEYNPIHSTPPFGKIKKKELPGFHIGLLHGSLKLSDHWKAEDAYVPLDPMDIAASRLDYLALGHYHNFLENDLGETKVVYPGTPEGRKFSEAGDRFLVIADFDRKPVRVQKIPWNKRSFARIELDFTGDAIENELDIIRGLKTYADSGDNILLRVIIKGTSEFVVPIDKIQDEMGKHFFYLEIDDRSTLTDSQSIESLAGERSVRGLFIRKIRERMINAPDREKKVLTNALRLAISRMQAGDSLEI